MSRRSFVPLLIFVLGGVLSLAVPAVAASTLSIDGTVADQTGRYLVGANVGVVPPGGSASSAVATAVTTADGSFAVNAPAGIYDIVVTNPEETGASQARLGKIVTPSGSNHFTVLVTRPSVTLSGVVRDSSGVPVDRGAISVANGRFGATDDLQTGHFDLAVPPGRYELAITGQAPDGSRWKLTAPGVDIAHSVTQDLVVPRAVNLDLAVRTEDGAPVTGADILLESADGVEVPFEVSPGLAGSYYVQDTETGVTDGTGHLRRTLLGRPRLKITAQAGPDSPFARASAIVTATADTTLTLTQRRPVTVAGTVRDSDGPLTGGFIQLVGDDSWNNAHIGPDGSYAVRIPPGRRTLTVMATRLDPPNSPYGIGDSVGGRVDVDVAGDRRLDLSFPTVPIAVHVADLPSPDVVGASSGHEPDPMLGLAQPFEFFPGGWGMASSGGGAKPDAAGNARVMALPSSTTVLQATSQVPNGGTARAAITVAGPTSAELRGVPRSIHVAGTVRWADGTPAAGIPLSLESKHSLGPTGGAVTATDGSYGFDVAPGAKLLKIGANRAWFAADVDVTGERYDTITLPQGKTTLRVFDRDGSPITTASGTPSTAPGTVGGLPVPAGPGIVLRGLFDSLASTGGPDYELAVPAPMSDATLYLSSLPAPDFYTNNTFAHVLLVDGANVVVGLGKSVAASGGARPATPVGVTATPAPGAAHVSWAGGHGGAAVQSWAVTIRGEGEPTRSLTLPGATTATTVTGLRNGASYTFTVTAIGANGAGPGSAPSSPLIPLAAPAAPRILTATSGPGSVRVTWDEPLDDGGSRILGATVIARAAGHPDTVVHIPEGITDATVGGLEPGVAYQLSVRVHNAFGEGPESPAIPQVAAAPGPGANRPGTGASGYWMIDRAGEVFGFGGATYLGGDHFADPSWGAADIEATRSGQGYWILDRRGGVHRHGDAGDFGDVTRNGPPLAAGEQAASLSATPTGAGYWIFTDRGRVFPFGDARSFGDLAGHALNGPVLDSVPTPTGQGYYMVASDGGIFAFGDAHFAGSMGATKLNKPVMSMAPDPDGHGYWLVAADGGIFAFDAPFYGSTGHLKLNKPVTGIVTGDAGYMMVAEDGGIFAFGAVPFHGSLGAHPPNSPVVSVARLG